MRIGVNTLFLIPNKVGGTETYARGLLSELEEIDKDSKYLVFCNKENITTFDFRSKSFQKIISPIKASLRPVRIVWEQLVFPFQLLRHGAEMVLSLGYVCPLITFCKSIVVIFDLNWFFHPEEFTFLNRLFWRILVTWSARRADIIVTSSQNSKKDIINVLHLPAEKIRVVYGGVDGDFFKPLKNRKEIFHIKNKYRLGERFIFTASAAYKFKNLDKLIEGFKSASNNIKDVKLLIVGLGGRGRGEVQEKIKRYKLEERVIIAGWVPNDDIPKLYAAADLCVHPSLYEGFGFPVLEAMACGCPVISSNAASLPELVGDAGILVDARDSTAIAKGIEKVLSDPTMAQQLRQRGLERSQFFTWHKAAHQLIEIYKEKS